MKDNNQFYTQDYYNRLIYNGFTNNNLNNPSHKQPHYQELNDNNDIENQIIRRNKTPKEKIFLKKYLSDNNNNYCYYNKNNFNNQRQTNVKDHQFENYNQNEKINTYSNHLNLNLNNMNINNEGYNNQHIDQYNLNETLLKIFIYIYYYEKDLSEKNIFINSNEKYYLIK